MLLECNIVVVRCSLCTIVMQCWRCVLYVIVCVCWFLLVFVLGFGVVCFLSSSLLVFVVCWMLLNGVERCCGLLLVVV